MIKQKVVVRHISFADFHWFRKVMKSIQKKISLDQEHLKDLLFV